MTPSAKLPLPGCRTAAALLVIAVLSFLGCTKAVPEGRLEKGQVALTFDDASVENWHRYLPLLDSLHIKATFYISGYHKFGKQQKALLKEIEKSGHEIAYHTANHLDLAKEVAKNGIGVTEEREVKSDLKLLMADGYEIANFAYPFGSYTSQLNSCLLRSFRSVRALSNQQNYNKSLVKESGEQKVLYGANVDNNSRLKDDGITALLNAAADHHDCLVLVAHQINNPNVKLQISKERLILMAKLAAERDLRFITIREIVY